MIDNATPWSCLPIGIADASGEPAYCIVIEATCSLDGTPVAEQPEICTDGSWEGDPASSAPLEAPVCTTVKHGTDLLLRGTATAERIDLRCAGLRQVARLRGPRTWVRRWYGIRPGPEGPREPVRLRWECAAGAQPSNPVGCGLASGPFRDGVALPLLEHPDQPVRRWGRAVAAVGFGATTPAWAHRRDGSFAANIAAPELITADGLRGDEAVAVDGLRCGDLAFRLPGLPPPRITLARRQGDLHPATRLDTVLIDADAGTIRLTWRAWATVGEWAAVDAVAVA